VDAHGLTTREREVCELLLQGLSNKEISRTLSVSLFTVQDCVKIFAKLSVGSRGELTSKLFLGYYMPRLKEGNAREFGLVRHSPRVSARPRSGARKTTGGAKG
jgi:DNA-binding CsgD family transcriptional regulator